MEETRRVFWLDEFKGKGRRRDNLRRRAVALDRFASRMFALWRKNRNPKPDDHVFINSKGNPWDRHALALARRRAAKATGVNGSGERIVAYTFRHTGATEATRAGLRDRLLADIMGHTTTATTARYQHLDADDLVAGIDRVAAARPRRIS